MTMGDAYGKSYASTRDLVVSSEGLTANALRLFVWMEPFFRDGHLLQGREAAALEEWLGERGYAGELKSVQTVQFSLGQAAADLFNGHKTEVKRQLSRLESSRVIESVGKAARGHAQLFVVNPNKVTSGCVPIEGENPNKATSGCVPNRNKYTSDENKYTSGGERVHIQGRIGTHPDPVTCGDETHPELYPENNPEAATRSPAPSAAGEASSVCPDCGGTLRRTASHKPNGTHLYLCPVCGSEDWRAA